jgi:hypothetical protein
VGHPSCLLCQLSSARLYLPAGEVGHPLILLAQLLFVRRQNHPCIALLGGFFRTLRRLPSFRTAHAHLLGQVHVERVDFLEPRVPQEEWASIRGHSVVGPEAAGMQAASLL